MNCTFLLCSRDTELLVLELNLKPPPQLQHHSSCHFVDEGLKSPVLCR